MRRTSLLFTPFFILILLLTGGCSKTTGESEEFIKDKDISLLIYIASNNSLYSYSKQNISELLETYSADTYKNGNIAVYYRGSDEDAPTLNIVNSSDSLKVIKTYDIHSSADVNVMREVISDFKSLFVSEEYGCIFWSHGSGWLPSSFTGSVSALSSASLLYSDTYSTQQSSDSNEPDITNHPLYNLIRQVDYTPQTRSFGQDGDDWLELDDLVEAIDDNEFDYMIFDACYMMGIEVMYALRNKADWILGSPTEVLGAGMEYGTMAQNLLSTLPLNERLTAVAEDFKDKYDEVTVSLVDLTKIENFATQFADLIKDITSMSSGLTSYSVQRYDRYSNHVIFDICDYISKLSPENSTAITELVDEIVEYKYSSNSFLYINMYNYNGVSSYIPFSSYNTLNTYYDQLSWSKEILNR